MNPQANETHKQRIHAIASVTQGAPSNEKGGGARRAFPASQQRQIRTQLSLVLQATVSQMLIPALDGTTIPRFEVMHMNTAIRNLIREEKTYQIDSVIASNGAAGMQTMDQALFNAVREGKVAKDVALQYSHHQEALLRRFQAEGL